MKSNPRAEKTILIIEENADTADLVRFAFSQLETCSAFVCRNTSEAKAYLVGAGMYADRREYPFPRAIISDLGSEDESGIDLLRWAKTERECQALPVYILADAGSKAQEQSAKELGAVKVFRKPEAVTDLKNLLNDIAENLCD